MDDEKYLTISNHNMPATTRYYTMNKDTCPDNVRFKGQDKYPVKVLVWIAISERGMTKPFVHLQKSAAINRKLYIDEKYFHTNPPKDNPPNVPQARPIENFWGCLSQKVYEDGWEAETEKQLINRIKLKLKDFDLNFLQILMRGIKRKLRAITDTGVFSYLK